MAIAACVQCTQLSIPFWNGNTITAPSLQKFNIFKFPPFLENKLQLKSLFLDKIKICYGESFCEIQSFIQTFCELCIVLGRWRAKQWLLDTCGTPVLNTEIRSILQNSEGKWPLNYSVILYTSSQEHAKLWCLIFTIIFGHFDCTLIFQWEEGGHILLDVFTVLLLSQLGRKWNIKLNWLCLVCSSSTPSWRRLRTTKAVGLAWQFRIQQSTVVCSTLSQHY
jgi:hypothetical protein